MTGTDAVPADDLAAIDRWCAADWPALQGARILITGGTGFIGTWLLASLLDANRRHGLALELLVVTRDPERFRRHAPGLAGDPALRLLPGDVRSLAIPDGRLTHLVHAAAEASAQLNRERPLEMVATIVDGTRRILEIARSQQVARLLFLSSGAVYGRQPADLAAVDEAHGGGPDPLHPTSAYGESKRLAELLCAATARASGIAIPIARLWAFVGPGLPLDAHFAAGNLIRDALAGGPLVVQGDGTATRSYLYAADLTAWLVRLLVRGTSLRAYNVGSPHALSIRDLAGLIAASVQPPPPVEIRGRPQPGVPVDRYIPAVGRVRDELGLEAWTTLEDAVRKTIAWHRRPGKVADFTVGQRR